MMMFGIPAAAASALGGIIGLTIIGFIGNTIIVEMGGKTLSIFWTIILTVAGSYIGLKYAGEGIRQAMSVFGI